MGFPLLWPLAVWPLCVWLCGHIQQEKILQPHQHEAASQKAINRSLPPPVCADVQTECTCLYHTTSEVERKSVSDYCKRQSLRNLRRERKEYFCSSVSRDDEVHGAVVCSVSPNEQARSKFIGKIFVQCCRERT